MGVSEPLALRGQAAAAYTGSGTFPALLLNQRSNDSPAQNDNSTPLREYTPCQSFEISPNSKASVPGRDRVRKMKSNNEGR